MFVTLKRRERPWERGFIVSFSLKCYFFSHFLSRSSFGFAFLSIPLHLYYLPIQESMTPEIPSAFFPGELYGLYGESLDLLSIFRLIFPHTFVGFYTSGLDSVLLYIPR